MLSASVVNTINSKIDDIFEEAKTRFLGHGKSLYITLDKDLTLPSIFEQAAYEEGGVPDVGTLNSLMTVASNYLDAAKAKAKAEILGKIQAFVEGTQFSEDNEAELNKEIKKQLSETWDTVTTGLETIVSSEAQKAKNVSLLDGIVRMNAVQEVDDPIVFWIVTRGGKDHPCEDCREMHLMPDGITPRLWKMSEVSYGYHVRGDGKPSISGLHPSCLCTLTTLLPGFGFNNIGRVTYMSDGYNALKEQRS